MGRHARAAEQASPDAVARAMETVEVRRSARRVRTVTAFREGGRLVVAIPARFTAVQEREWVARMVARVAAKDARRRPSDDALAQRASELSERYLGGRARPTSVTWSTRQGGRWGSCTPTEGTIRISSRVRGMPAWVLDYVLVHELVHLLVPGHGPEFWAFVDRYPKSDRARGFLEGVSYTQQTPDDDAAGDEAADHEKADDEVADGGVDEGRADGGPGTAPRTAADDDAAADALF